MKYLKSLLSYFSLDCNIPIDQNEWWSQAFSGTLKHMCILGPFYTVKQRSNVVVLRTSVNTKFSIYMYTVFKSDTPLIH